MGKGNWLFRKIGLSLRTEIIINISLLMLAAILLIGFTTAKINEKNLIQEKIKNGEGTIQDFQGIIDFLAKDKKDFTLAHPFLKKEIQDFVRIYIKERGVYDLVIVDHELKVIASKRIDLVDKSYSNDIMKNSILLGQLNYEIEKSGGFLSPHYRKLILYSPLWGSRQDFRGDSNGNPHWGCDDSFIEISKNDFDLNDS